MFYAIQDFIEMVRIKSKIDICRDVKDNFLLNLAVDGKADYLITGDKDLLILEQIENTKIITMNEFKTLN
jgi:putative PIN family toxin of toxin-antitoxin system